MVKKYCQQKKSATSLDITFLPKRIYTLNIIEENSNVY